jgi:hypothetical protein
MKFIVVILPLLSQAHYESRSDYIYKSDIGMLAPDDGINEFAYNVDVKTPKRIDKLMKRWIQEQKMRYHPETFKQWKKRNHIK